MRYNQQEIINTLGVRPDIVPKQEIRERVDFLKYYLGEAGLKGLVLGISGGQDSLLAGILAQQAAAERRNEGFEASFHAVLLPYGEQADRADALLACKTIQPDSVHDFNIKATTDAFAETFASTEGTPITDFDKGNVKARLRMVAQYAIAGHYNLLVVGTDHAAEAVTGFFTKYGDGGADILPLSGLTKRQGKQLLRELNAPEHFTTKQPTADLLDGRPGQADEAELGMRYSDIDDYLEGKIVEEPTARAIEARYFATEHKRTVPVSFQ